MDGIGAIGHGPHDTIAIGDKQFNVRPLVVADWIAFERRTIDSRPDPLAVVIPHVKGLDREVASDLLQWAADRHIAAMRPSAAEVSDWMSTLDGSVRVLQSHLSDAGNEELPDEQSLMAFIISMTPEQEKAYATKMRRLWGIAEKN